MKVASVPSVPASSTLLVPLLAYTSPATSPVNLVAWTFANFNEVEPKFLLPLGLGKILLVSLALLPKVILPLNIVAPGIVSKPLFVVIVGE